MPLDAERFAGIKVRMLKRISWVQTIILPIALALLIVAWLSPWVHWLTRSTELSAVKPVPSAWLLLGLLLGGTYATRFAMAGERSPRVRQLMVIVPGLLAIFLVAWLTYGNRFLLGYVHDLLDWQNSVSAELIALIASVLLWWRGILAGRKRTISDETLERTFLHSIVALGLLLFINNFNEFVPAPEMLLSVLTLFATGLSALTVISIEHTRLRQQAAPDPWSMTNRHWLATIVTVVGLILVGGLSVTGVLSPETLNRFVAAIGPLLSALGSFLEALLVAIFAVLSWLATPFIPLLQWLARALYSVLFTALSVLNSIGLAVNNLRRPEEVDNFFNSPEFVSISRGATVAVILVLFVVVSIWVLRRWGLLAGKRSDEIRESIASRDLLLKQVRELLARWRKGVPASPPPYFVLDGPPEDPRLMARRAYQSMLDWATGLGRPRFPYQTPTTYAAALGAELPSVREAIDALTAIYVQARYATDPPSLDEARRAQQAALDLRTEVTLPPAP